MIKDYRIREQQLADASQLMASLLADEKIESFTIDSEDTILVEFYLYYRDGDEMIKDEELETECVDLKDYAKIPERLEKMQLEFENEIPLHEEYLREYNHQKYKELIQLYN